MDHRQTLKCSYVNIQSLRNKTLEVREFINDNNLDILCVTETWLKDSDSSVVNECCPSTHTFYGRQRQEKRGGGVGAFLAGSLKHVKIIDQIRVNSFEYLQIVFKNRNEWVMMLVIYRSPSSSPDAFFQEFDILLESLDLITYKTFICGDFNFWMEDRSLYNVKKMNDLLDAHGLRNNIKDATANTGHALDMIIDDNNHNKIGNIRIDKECVLSPVHMIINFDLKYTRLRYKKKILYRDKKDFSPESFIEEIIGTITNRLNEQCQHNSNRIKSDCIDCKVEVMSAETEREYDSRCPWREKIITIVDNSPWFDGEIALLKRDKKRLENRWNRQRTEETKIDYIIVKRRYNLLLKKKKADYYKNKIDKAGTDMKKIYAVLDNLIGKTNKRPLPEGLSDQVLAGKFMEFFNSKIENIASSFSVTERLRDYNIPVISDEDKLEKFEMLTMDTLNKIICKTKKTYCLLDPVPIAEIIQAENFESYKSLTLSVINDSISSCIFPHIEKRGIIKPTLKGNLDKQELCSYRPVTNLSYMSKLIEYSLKDQLIEHLRRVRALPECQSAYRSFHSTETSITAVICDAIQMLDEKKSGILMLLDLSAAFDTVVHSLLIEDLQEIGIGGDALLLLRDYLSNRRYKVQVGNETSDEETLKRGVPQGSVLGPLLFCIYTRELEIILRRFGVKFMMYADDTQIYLSFSGIENTKRIIEEIVKTIKDWMNYKKLKLNENKTEFLFVARKDDDTGTEFRSMKINNEEINFKECVRDLGVLIDSNLTFEQQINEVVRKSGYCLRNIAHIKKYIDESSLKKLVINGVITRLDYCNSVYQALPNTRLHKLQMILNRSARLIKGLSPRDRITPALMDLHWLPIKARIKYKLCVLTYQTLLTGEPGYLKSKLIVMEPVNTVNTRRATQGFLVEPRVTSSLGFRGFKSAAPRVFNGLPLEVKGCDNVKLFKKKLKTFLFNDCYCMESKTITLQYEC